MDMQGNSKRDLRRLFSKCFPSQWMMMPTTNDTLSSYVIITVLSAIVDLDLACDAGWVPHQVDRISLRESLDFVCSTITQ